MLSNFVAHPVLSVTLCHSDTTYSIGFLLLLFLRSAHAKHHPQRSNYSNNIGARKRVIKAVKYFKILLQTHLTMQLAQKPLVLWMQSYCHPHCQSQTC